MTFRSPSLPTLLATSLVLMHSPGGVKAATYYWDNNDATAGFGTASGIWAAPTTNNTTQGWSPSLAGQPPFPIPRPALKRSLRLK